MSKATCTVILNTNRPEPTLVRTLGGLELLDQVPFEVIIVRGPDVKWGVDDVGGRFTHARFVECPTANISISRNIGLGHASGAVVAFIDDDAIPEPDWLITLLAPFDDPEVAAVGGPVLDHTGAAYQALFSTVTRGGLARSSHCGPNPSSFLNAPSSWVVPTTMGTNSLFRRDALVFIGGFDEEIDYYLDESEVCIRLVDEGWRIELMDRGCVHHKFLPSSVRGAERAVTDWFPIVKNAAYVAFRHGMTTGSVAQTCSDLSLFYEEVRQTSRHHEDVGNVPPGAANALDQVLEIAPGVGQAAASRPPRLGSSRFGASPSDLHLFPTLSLPAPERLHVCLLSQEYPPGPVGGVGRVIADVAAALASRGHVVRVVTRTSGEQKTIDLEDRVWVHRLPQPTTASSDDLPHRTYAAAVDAEVRAIHSRRPVDVVYAPNWDSEGLAVIERGDPPVVLGLYTPVMMLEETDPRLSGEGTLITALMDDELICYAGAAGFVACGQAIVDDISRAYGIRFNAANVTISPHGLRDVPCDDAERPTRRAADVLVVGRLEPRKGTDVMLRAAVEILEDQPKARLVFAGDDRQMAPDGRSYAEMADAILPPDLRPRVEMLGEVSDEDLHALYRSCAVVAVPSRFESFGLPAIEAMRAGAPVVASATGGLKEVIEDGVTGLLVAPEDPESLAGAIRTLLANDERRAQMGEVGRRRFEEAYSLDACAARLEACFREAARSSSRPAPYRT